jgi:LysM repeat protein
MRYFLIVVLSILSIPTFATYQTDSIGVERIDGAFYILHKVEGKETLYSLSRRYQVEVKSIIQANPASENGISIGQIIKVPVHEERLPVVHEEVVHIVKPQETLYSIARMYEVTPEEIKRWNHISTSILDIGQKLKVYPGLSELTKPVNSSYDSLSIVHVVADGETLYSISRGLNIPLDSLRGWNELLTNDISIGDSLIIGKRTENSSVQSVPAIFQPVDSTGSFDPAAMLTEEIFEDGLAEVIQGSANTKKYLGLHRYVPVGTVMRVRNEMNGKEVFVRIIGKLPDTGANRNIVIKISEAAYQNLSAIDERFRVTVSYLP